MQLCRTRRETTKKLGNCYKLVQIGHGNKAVGTTGSHAVSTSNVQIVQLFLPLGQPLDDDLQKIQHFQKGAYAYNFNMTGKSGRDY